MYHLVNQLRLLENPKIYTKEKGNLNKKMDMEKKKTKYRAGKAEYSVKDVRKDGGNFPGRGKHWRPLFFPSPVDFTILTPLTHPFIF